MAGITIVIPNYNKARFIKESIDSLLRQDVSQWQAIIMDDGSTDDSIQFLRTYAPLKDPRFTIHVNPQRNGKAYCLNRMIKLATNDIIGELDSDDALAESCLRQILKAYSRSDAGFIYTNFVFCDEQLKKVQKGWGRKIPEGRTAMDDIYVSAFRTFRKSAFLKTPGLDEKLTNAVDKDLIYKMEEVTQFDFVDCDLYYYRTVVPSLSRGVESEARALDNCARVKSSANARRGISVDTTDPRSNDLNAVDRKVLS